jgi:hypothetical protein
MLVEHRRLHPEDVAKEEEFWAWKKQELWAARTEKRRKKAWIEAEFNNSNTELDDEDRAGWTTPSSPPRRALMRSTSSTSFSSYIYSSSSSSVCVCTAAAVSENFYFGNAF